jgi:NRPS condensation-like uncharacterized protein
MWFAQLLDPSASIYNVADYVEIIGDVDLTSLVTAVSTAVADIETLRVRFEADGEDVRQVVESMPGWRPDVVDCVTEVAALSWMRADLGRPFDLVGGPVFRFAVLSLPNRAFLYLCAHHIAVDGHTYRLLLRRIVEVYTALVGGHRVPESTLSGLESLIADDLRYQGSAEYDRDRD